MTQHNLEETRENLQHRLLTTVVMALSFLIWRQFTTSKIIVFVFWACTVYGILVFALWLWVSWQLIHFS